MVAPQVVFGMSWLAQRARAEAEKAPPPSPELVAELAQIMGWVPAAPPLARTA